MVGTCRFGFRKAGFKQAVQYEQFMNDYSKISERPRVNYKLKFAEIYQALMCVSARNIMKEKIDLTKHRIVLRPCVHQVNLERQGDPRKSFAISLGGRESLIKGENCFQLHEQARCSDFRCEDFICLSGYLKKGSTCVDTNECEHASHQCSDNAICMDTEGRDSDGFEFNLSFIESYGLLDQSERSTGL